MPATSQYEALQEKWREFTEIEKTEILAAFIKIYGEDATWEEWRDFLYKYWLKGFEKTHSVD
jgi:hypothetical protein